MNKSKEYIMLKSNQRRQPAIFKRADWMHGDVEEMVEFLRKYYNQKLHLNIHYHEAMYILQLN